MSHSPRSSETATVRNDTPTDQTTEEEEKRAFITRHLNGSTYPYAIGADRERHGILSRRGKKDRKTLGLHYVKTLGILTILLWACLSIFWGSTYQLLKYFSRLSVNVYDFDTPTSETLGFIPILGPAYTSYARQSNSLPLSTPHVGYNIIDCTRPPYSLPASEGGGVWAARRDLIENKAWAAIVVHGNATQSWRSAIEGAEGGYDPQGSVGVYYEGARYYQIVLLYLRPFLLKDATMVLQTASQQALSTILSSLSASYTAPSQYPATTTLTPTNGGTLLANLRAVPQAMSGPFGYYVDDIRPQTAWGAAAVFEAGDIYYLIFTFHLALWHYLGRSGSGLQDKLKLKSLIGLRLLVPVFFYFWMALWYTCIIAAFKVPFDNTVGRAGFVVDWALNYVTLLALGLAFETMLSVLTAQFLPLFLIVWIILNITSSFQPLAVLDPFYKWFVIFPFYHHVMASKIIFFNTAPARKLGLHFGALFGVIGVHLICLPTAVWFERWRDERSAKKEQEKKKQEEQEKGEQDRGEEGERE